MAGRPTHIPEWQAEIDEKEVKIAYFYRRTIFFIFACMNKLKLVQW